MNIDQIRAQMTAFFVVREARAEPLTLVEEAIKYALEDPSSSAVTLRWGHKDLMGYVREVFSAHEKAQFETLCGSTGKNFTASEHGFVDDILARGRLRNNDEFRQLLCIVDSLVQCGKGSSERVEKANRLLADFESSKVKKRRKSSEPGEA